MLFNINSVVYSLGGIILNLSIFLKNNMHDMEYIIFHNILYTSYYGIYYYNNFTIAGSWRKRELNLFQFGGNGQCRNRSFQILAETVHIVSRYNSE